MHITRKPTFYPEGAVLILGNFDGVHRGHTSLLKEWIREAKALQATPVVLTFYPSPKAYFAKENFSVITPLAEKIQLLAAAGLFELLFLRFNQKLAELPPNAFIEQYLLKMNVKAIIVGDDFHFGKDRTGNVDTLSAAGKRHGFAVYQINTQCEGGVRISSSRIRAILKAGQVAEAEALLGHSLCVTGRVMPGDQRGRLLGFPTMNFAMRDPVCFSGIFAVSVEGLFHSSQPAVASLGTRPMYHQGKQQILEVFVFDRVFNAYGKKIKICFHHKIRDEAIFENEAALIKAMQQDVQAAKHYFGIA